MKRWLLLIILVVLIPYRTGLYKYIWKNFAKNDTGTVYVGKVVDGDKTTLAEKRQLTKNDTESAYVKKVIDGDTIMLANRKKVRLIGIDTPELYECDKLFRDARRSNIPPKKIQVMARESCLFTKLACEKKTVTLEFDLHRYDKYGRILAYVHLPDGKLLNQEIIEQGYGLAYLFFPFNQEYRKRFIQSENDAKKHQRGLWGKYRYFRNLK